MTPEEVARKWSSRAGFTLVDYQRVALPVFQVRLKVLELQKKPVPTLHEFVLRALQTGMTAPEQITGFLGLEEQITRDVLHSLLATDDIAVMAKDGSYGHSLLLTEKGKQTLRELVTVVPEETILTINVDGLTREILLPQYGLINRRQAKDQQMLELPAFPDRRPRIEEIHLDDLRQVLRNAGVGRGIRGSKDVIAILDFARVERLFRDDAVMLIYKAIEGKEVQFALVLGGQISEAHEHALRRADQKQRVKIVPDEIEDARGDIETVLGPTILAELPPPEDTTTLEREARSAREAEAVLRKRLEDPSSKVNERELLEQLRTTEESRAKAESLLESHPIRWLEVFEHPGYLKEALAKATQRVLIISPWIKAVVLDEYMELLRGALKRGVAVYIGYGLAKERKKESVRDRVATRTLTDLARQSPNLHLQYLGDTHAKILVCDRAFAIVTSFNWLSFLGDPEKTFRDERGTYVGIPESIDDLFARYMSRFRRVG